MINNYNEKSDNFKPGLDKACKAYATIARGKTTGMEISTVWDAVLFA